MIRLNNQQETFHRNLAHITIPPLKVSELTESVYRSQASCDGLELTFQDDPATFERLTQQK